MRADADLTGADLRGAIFRRLGGWLSLSDADLRDVDFNQCDGDGWQFEGCDLGVALFMNAHLRKCMFTNVDLSGSHWGGAFVERTWFRDADFSRAVFRHAAFFEGGVPGARFHGAAFDPEIFETDMTDADFTGASFASGSFGGPLDGAKLEGAIVAPAHKAEFWMELTCNCAHVGNLRQALTTGTFRLDGPEGTHAGLSRTWRALRGEPMNVRVDPNATELCAVLFGLIRRGDRPDSPTAGGFALRLLVDWIDEHRRLTDTETS